MSLRQRYLTILSAMIPAGAVGVSLLLGAAPGEARLNPATAQPAAAQRDGVSERLAAIREAVSAVAERQAANQGGRNDNLRLAWGNWWNNFGWGRPWGRWGWPNWNNWRNWNNWNNWWRNW